MKRYSGLIFFLALLSVLAGYLFSKVSLVGRIGMSLFYKEYNFFKTWWKGGLLVFGILMLLLLIQAAINKYASIRASIVSNLCALGLAIAGLMITYSDFRHTTSHRWAGERFHLGGYCFWMGWMIISLYLLVNRNNKAGEIKTKK